MMQPPGSRGGYVPIPSGARPPVHRPPPSSAMQQKPALVEEAPPTESQEEASVEVVAQEESSQVTVGLVIISLLAYACINTALQLVMPTDDEAVAAHASQVPVLVYQMSATAFFTSFVLNLTSFLFEDSSTKRQLALLSCTIKGAACYTDLLMVSSKPLVLFDCHGSLFVPYRYNQWAITTPLMVYILSKISDFTPRRTAIAAGADFLLVLLGFLSHLCPAPYHWLFFGTSSLLFVFVVYEMGAMVLSAIRASSGSWSSANAQRSLVFIYLCTLVIWNMFPVFYLISYFQPQHMLRNEMLVCFANFTAKVLFSSSIMYGNYMTIEQRRLLSKAAEESARRIQMVCDLKEAVNRKDQFMSLMSHELRTPLNGIIQLSDALCRGAGGQLNEKGAHFMTTIKNSSNHLLNIINDILDVAALKEGKLAIKHECVDLAKAVGHVVDIVSPLAKKEVRIEQRVDPNTPLVVADFSRMVQVLYNLMGNALKFTKSGHVRVTVAPKDQTGAQVIIRVEDTGIGIPKAKIPTIWGAFEQVDMSVTRKFGGTGLGLNIVQQLVTSHEGTITCESKEGAGTCFTIILPVLQRNSRPSLEEQVRSSAMSLGYSWDTLVRAIPGGRSNSSVGGGGSARNSGATAYQTVPHSSSLERYPSTRVGHPSGHSMEMQGFSTINNPLANTRGSMMSGGLNASDMPSHQQADKFLRQRTDDLEREALMNDLARRTEMKRSMDEATYYNPVADHQSSAGRPIPPGGGGIHGPAAAYAASGNYMQHDAAMVATAVAGAEAMCGLPASGTTNIHLQPGQGGVWAGHSERKPMHPRLTSLAQTGGIAAQRSRTEPGVEPRVEDDMGMMMVGAGGRGFRGGPLTASGGFSTPGGGNIRGGDRTSAPAMRRGPAPAWSSTFTDDDGQGVMYNEAQSAPVFGGADKPMGRLGPSQCGAPPNMGGGSSAPHGLSLDKLAYSNMYGQVQILSVDDEEVNQIVLEEILTSAGYQYARAMDGAEALDWLEAQQTLPDLILLDCMMPNMSGHEFCCVLRQYIPSSVLPVIMVSAKSDNENIVEGLRSGSNDFVRKPYQREELLARIETQLRLKNDSWWLAELMNNQDGRENESMKLLKNILPEGIITRMQAGQKFVADSHSHVVILFSDIVGFTNLSSKLPTAEVFLMLSNMFNAFDKLTDRFSVYKVETIGDAYMVAAGHDEDPTKAAKGTPIERIISMARGMLDVVQHTTAPNGEKLKIRIGIHCGPAFAGVIGSKCPRYCFLGDTVNTASRMESLSFPMCVQVSANLVEQWSSGRPEDTVRLGERMVKGKGLMTTYLLKYGEWEEGQHLYEQLKNNPTQHNQQSMLLDTGSLLGTEPNTATAAMAATRTSELPDFAKLVTAGTSSPEVEAELDSVRDQLASTKGQLTALKEQLAAVKEHLLSTQEQLAMTKEQLATSKEQVTATKEQLAKEQMVNAQLAKDQLAREQLLKEQLTSEQLIPTAINLATRNVSSTGVESGSEAANLRVELTAVKELLASATVKLDKSQAQVAFAEKARDVAERARELALQEVAVAQQQADMERQRATSALEKVIRVRSIVAQLNAQRGALNTAYPDSAAHSPTAELAATLNSSSTAALFAPNFISAADKAALLSGPDTPLAQTISTVHVPPSQQLVNASHARNSFLMLKPHYQRYFTASSGAFSIGTSVHDASQMSLLSQAGPDGGIKAVRNNDGSRKQASLLGGFTTDKFLLDTNMVSGEAGAGPLLPAISMASILDDLGFSAYKPRFRSEAVTLDQLLELDIAGLQALGMVPLGHCLRLRSVICDLAAMLLRACEERAEAVMVCDDAGAPAPATVVTDGASAI